MLPLLHRVEHLWFKFAPVTIASIELLKPHQQLKEVSFEDTKLKMESKLAARRASAGMQGIRFSIAEGRVSMECYKRSLARDQLGWRGDDGLCLQSRSPGVILIALVNSHDA